MAEINSQTRPSFDGEVSFESTRKKIFRIDGDDNRVLSLNTSDLGIVSRLRDAYPKMSELTSKYAERKLDEVDDEESINQFADILQEMDLDMRGLVDYIFDSDVSKVCVPDGTMFDMFNGQFRYEIIIEEISKLYESNLSMEYRKMKARVDAKANKYIGK